MATLPHVDSTDVLVGDDFLETLWFSPSGAALVGESFSGSSNRIWHLDSHQVQDVNLGSAVGREVISPSGALVAVVLPEDTVRIWDVAADRYTTYSFSGVTSLAVAADDRLMATRTGDGRIQFWDVSGGQGARSIPGAPSLSVAGGVSDMTISPGGRTLATISNRTLQMWSVASGRPVGAPIEPVDEAGFSTDDRILIAVPHDSTRPAQLWDVASGVAIGGLGPRVETFAFSRDGARLALATSDEKVLLWSRATDRVITLLRQQVDSLAFDPPGAVLATGGRDSVVQLWDVATGRLLRTLRGHVDPVSALAFSPDGATLASASFDGTVRLWKVR